MFCTVIVFKNAWEKSHPSVGQTEGLSTLVDSSFIEKAIKDMKEGKAFSPLQITSDVLKVSSV